MRPMNGMDQDPGSSQAVAPHRLRQAATERGLCIDDGFTWRISSRLCLGVEHGDYNGAELLGIGIDRFLWIAARDNSTRTARLFSCNRPDDGVVVFDPATPQKASRNAAASDWSPFAHGAADVLRSRGHAVRRGFDAVVYSEIPGGGMSRSAALSIALLLTFAAEPRALLADRMELARMAQAIENEHLGSPCGILDPLVIAHAHRGAAVRYQPDGHRVTHIPWGGDPMQLCVLALDTGRSRHGLQQATYPERVRECAQIVALAQPSLGGQSLAHLASGDRYERTLQLLTNAPSGLSARLRYLNGAIARFPRMLAAFAAGDARELGRCMREDGISLRSDYCISGPELEGMCEIARAHPGSFGERMLGGGDCGASGAIVDPACAEDILAAVQREYPKRFPAFAHAFATHRCAMADGIAAVALR